MKMTVRHISDVCSAKFYLSFNTFNFISLLLRAVTFVYLKSSDFVVEKLACSAGVLFGHKRDRPLSRHV